MLKVANNKLIVGKEEYHLFSAEMHYFRVSKRYWSICFERIRKAGFRILSTRVPWNLHEGRIGDFDFTGETGHTKDLVVFLELAREFGLKVILHPGPYISSEWKNGGYPDFLHNSPEMLARDPNGEPVEISLKTLGKSEEEWEKQSVFSPLHPRFLHHVKRYLGALTDLIKSYVYPKGPVILVRLDNGFSSLRPDQFPENLSPFSSDYNEHLTGSLFPEYLQEKYQDAKKLSQLYGEKHRDFKNLRPPHELKISKPQNLVKYFDWISFKEKACTDYILKLKELYLSFETSPLFSTQVFSSKDFSLPFNWKASESEELFSGMSVIWKDDYVDLVRHLRYFSACSNFPWASEFSVGSRADSPEDGEKYFPVGPRDVKFLLTTALASGIKGFNHYMFVERDSWYDAPLANDGTIRPSFDLIKRFNELTARIELENLESPYRVGLANYRPYLWFDHLSAGAARPAQASGSSRKAAMPFSYLPFLLSKTHKGLSQDLINLKLDFGIPDLWLDESLEDFPVILVPCAEFMDKETQQRLVDLAKAGKTLILFGLLPKFDLNMKECNLLAGSLKLRTRAQFGVGRIQTSGQEFITSLYGYMRGAKRSQILARQRDRVLGAVLKLGKGRVFVFCFDISAQLHHHKLAFLEEILKQAGVRSRIYCDAPEVDLVLKRDEKNTILCLLNSSPTSSTNYRDDRRKLILRFDPRKVGLKGRRLRFTDLLGEEIIKTTPDELRTGLIIELPPHDSRMYLVESK
ncbi:MAG: beta-galactosidase [Candidatus Zixiibacteriota bacterium]|nr:MAG: beta-galactosidase [candidate division Zixibacteria bacterium]